MKQNVARSSWLGVTFLLIIAVVVGALVVLALQKTSPSERAAAAPPAPISSPSRTAAPTETPAVTTPPVIAPPDERFLAVGEGVLWRGTAGSCSEGIAPLLERSTDDGATWADATPTYRGITQLMRVMPFAGAQADLVAALDDGACEAQGLRTFSDGAYWADEAIPEPAAYLGADGAPRIGADAIDPPCAEPSSMRGSAPTVAAVCDGRVLARGEAGWAESGMQNAVAVAVRDRTIVAAHLVPDCSGLAISTTTANEEPVFLTCVTELDPSLPTAIAMSNDRLAVWNGGALALSDLSAAE